MGKDIFSTFMDSVDDGTGKYDFLRDDYDSDMEPDEEMSESMQLWEAAMDGFKKYVNDAKYCKVCDWEDCDKRDICPIVADEMVGKHKECPIWAAGIKTLEKLYRQKKKKFDKAMSEYKERKSKNSDGFFDFLK